jgi:hypothetical protein
MLPQHLVRAKTEADQVILATSSRSVRDCLLSEHEGAT